jgi:two-component system nitrogen regulation response regulator GlnG
VARQLIIASRGRSEVALTPQLERVIATSPTAAMVGEAATPELRTLRKPSEVGEEELLAVLEAHRWDLAATARALHITQPSLYMLIERSGRVRTAGDLDADEIARCHQDLGGDLDEMALHLRVSKSALRRRLRELGLR